MNGKFDCVNYRVTLGINNTSPICVPFKIVASITQSFNLYISRQVPLYRPCEGDIFRSNTIDIPTYNDNFGERGDH